MKVWELIQRLEKLPAGAQVNAAIDYQGANTVECSEVEDVCENGFSVNLIVTSEGYEDASFKKLDFEMDFAFDEGTAQ